MKITIDTANDSHEDIRKVVAFLSHWVDSKGAVGLSSSPSSSSSGFGLADLFGGNAQNAQQTPIPSSSSLSPSSSGAFDLHQMIHNQEPDNEEPKETVKLDRY